MVPKELVVDGREFYVIRVHNGEAEKLEVTKNADGTYSFETDRFSSYALAYDEAVQSPDEVPETTPETTPDTVPDTGDTTNVAFYISLMCVGFVALLFAKKMKLQ